jgi:acetyl-CoA/propionyl-CoA carboxylase biotin carboxyl carrier protein
MAVRHGVRWDGGYETGDEISQFYDNLTGKLCVWGQGPSDRAIARMIRALEETVDHRRGHHDPADLAILSHPDFAAFEHSTKWVEEVLDLTGIGGAAGAPPDADDAEQKVERNVLVEVGGKRFDVKMWIPESEIAASGGGAAARPRPRRSGGGGGAIAAAGTGAVAVPMQGTIVKVLVEVGQEVEAADTVCVLEAMKMENNIAAGVDGTVTEVKVETGSSVSNGDVVIIITPAE